MKSLAALFSEPGSKLLPGCVVIAVVVILSCASYVGNLGLYSDDWAIVGAFANAENNSLTALLSAVFPHTAARPVQSLYLAVLFRLFEANPVGYHTINHVVLLLTALLFYVCLRKLHVPQFLALAWPLVFATLPHYSTDRFWIAAFQANLSMLLYFLSLFAALSTGSGASHALFWRILSVIAMAASVMAYELTAPLFLLNPLLEAANRVSFRVPEIRRALKNAVTPWAATIAVIALAVLYKAALSDRATVDQPYWPYFQWLAGESLAVNFVGFGLYLPEKVVVILMQLSNRASLANSFGGGVAAGLGVFFASASQPLDIVRRKNWFLLAVAGVGLNQFAYLVFLFSSYIAFAETGISNRTAIAAALGVALSFVGTAGWIASCLPHREIRRICFSLAVAFLCFSGILINTTVASYWVDARYQQNRVIEAVRNQFPQIQSGTTLLIDGMCLYTGPGIVFETDWDVSGMLRLYYRDTTLVGNVVKSTTVVSPDGISTPMYGSITRYGYANTLLIYHVGQGIVHTLSDLQVARRHFETVPRPECAEGVEGFGTPIF